jgi:hypothetical protein
MVCKRCGAAAYDPEHPRRLAMANTSETEVEPTIEFGIQVRDPEIGVTTQDLESRPDRVPAYWSGSD